MSFATTWIDLLCLVTKFRERKKINTYMWKCKSKTNVYDRTETDSQI